MFALVKSLFFSSSPTDEGLVENRDENETDPDVCEKSQIPNEKKVQEANAAVSSPKNSLEASVYLVDGLEFECLMEACAIDFELGQIRRMIFVPSSESGVAPIAIRIDHIGHLRQHLPDAFQFVVRSNKNEGGLEYGVKLDSDIHALRLRQALYPLLLDSGEQIFEIKCAVAEYDLTGREFVLLSKAATARIFRRSSDSESFFSIQLPDGRVIYTDCLSRESQLWPSPQSRQLTFWGLDYRVPGNSKKMFLLEMHPSSVGTAAIVSFYNTLAEVLDDPLFAVVNRSNENDASGSIDRAPPPPEDDFDLGSLGNENQLSAWKPLGSSVPKPGRASDVIVQPRQSFPGEGYDFHDLEQLDGSDDGVEPIKYIADVDRECTGAPSHRFMEVGTQRTFVCRGNSASPNYPLSLGRDVSKRTKSGKAPNFQLEVYKKEFTGDDGEEILQTVGNVQGSRFSFQGEQFVPLKGMLHKEEHNLLVIPENHESNDGSIYMMDLNAEKVVQRWTTNGTGVSTIFPSFKNGGASTDPTFLCTNSRNIFMMDTRMPPNSAKATNISYTTNPQLSVGTTDESGHMLIGSRLGELRLFDGKANAQGNYKRAKTLLQSIREPISAVDVTADGSWILATTKTFLVVFPTKLADGGRTGFETALGQHKPAPRFLMLHAEDLVKYQITDINFAPAKFDAEEECIVTSTGNMAVVWDFGTVKRGKPFYSVRFADESIKDVQVVADSASVVVAYPDDVGLFGTERRVVQE